MPGATWTRPPKSAGSTSLTSSRLRPPTIRVQVRAGTGISVYQVRLGNLRLAGAEHRADPEHLGNQYDLFARAGQRWEWQLQASLSRHIPKTLEHIGLGLASGSADDPWQFYDFEAKSLTDIPTVRWWMMSLAAVFEQDITASSLIGTSWYVAYHGCDPTCHYGFVRSPG